jgi:hypothetical protein
MPRGKTRRLEHSVAPGHPTREFELVYGQATDLLKSFPDFQFKTITAIVIIIGWLVTSESAQRFIHSHSSIAMPATVLAFGTLVVFKFIWILGYYRQLRSTYRHLVELASNAGIRSETLAIFRLTPVLPVTYLVIHIILNAAAITVVWLICK